MAQHLSMAACNCERSCFNAVTMFLVLTQVDGKIGVQKNIYFFYKNAVYKNHQTQISKIFQIHAEARSFKWVFFKWNALNFGKGLQEVYKNYRGELVSVLYYLYLTSASGQEIAHRTSTHLSMQNISEFQVHLYLHIFRRFELGNSNSKNA